MTPKQHWVCHSEKNVVRGSGYGEGWAKETKIKIQGRICKKMIIRLKGMTRNGCCGVAGVLISLRKKEGGGYMNSNLQCLLLKYFQHLLRCNQLNLIVYCIILAMLCININGMEIPMTRLQLPISLHNN